MLRQKRSFKIFLLVAGVLIASGESKEMMKIQIMSDLHLEFHPDRGRGLVQNMPVLGDTLILAGDVSPVDWLYPSLDALCKRYERVIFVAGNHELYGSGRGPFNRTMEKVMRRNGNLYHLNNTVAIINGQRFVGTTMWFPQHHDGLNLIYQNGINDFNLVAGIKKWVYQANDAAQKFLKENIQEGDIVVTHHAPCWSSISRRFVNSELNRFYVCNMVHEILTLKPAIWIHGHVHSSNDYVVGDTRVISNPCGYYGRDVNPTFTFKKVVEID